METNLVIEGVKFMFLGMTTVFAFLIMMIFTINLMSSIIHKFFPEPQATEESVSGTTTQQQDNKKIIAAITAAIAYHRQG